MFSPAQIAWVFNNANPLAGCNSLSEGAAQRLRLRRYSYGNGYGDGAAHGYDYDYHYDHSN